MKYILIFALLTSTFQLLEAQPIETVIKSQAIQMGKAMVAGDTKTFSKFMLPELMAAGGGGEKAIKQMDSAINLFKQFGGQVSRITYGQPAKVVKYEKELQTYLPQTTELTSAIADVTFTSSIIAISRDNGKNWYFYDANMAQARDIKDKLPTLSPEIKLPPPAKPKITMKTDTSVNTNSNR
jgi:hypothetical protein